MIIGTAGHIDHGKTALVRALTGVDTDRLKEEKARGITIDLGYAYQPLGGDTVLGFVDVPGHERFVHNMLAGATGIEFALLVIAADDGVMPQTVEHLQILKLLGIPRGAIAITKIDLVPPARVAEVERAVRALLCDTLLAEAPIFRLSAVSGEGVTALRAYLEQQANAQAPQARSGLFRLAVDRCFALQGVGTVVTGTVFSGVVHESDAVRVAPTGLSARVRGLHRQDQPAATAQAGDRCALNLAGPKIDRQAIHRGDWVVADALRGESATFDAWLGILASETRPLAHWTPVHVHIGAADLNGRVALLEGDRLAPGEAMPAQLVVDAPVAACLGDYFVIRDQSAQRTVGGGRVLDLFPPTRGKRAPARLAYLRALHDVLAAADPAQALQAALRAALGTHPNGFDLNRFARNANLDADALQVLIAAAELRVIREGDDRLAFDPAGWQALGEKTLAALAAAHEREPELPGIERERLRRMTAPALPSLAFRKLLMDLDAARRVVNRGQFVALPEHKAELSARDQELWIRLKPLLQANPLQPPRVRDIARLERLLEADTRRLLSLVARLGEVYQVAHDHFFLQAAVVDLARVAAELAHDQGVIRAAPFRDQIGVGRKLAIQILEFFDRVGYTRRVRDDHLLRQPDFWQGAEGASAPGAGP
jgi:selenocysteine-specific elongation factor